MKAQAVQVLIVDYDYCDDDLIQIDLNYYLIYSMNTTKKCLLNKLIEGNREWR
jgi:hypothetical protein